MRKILLSFLFSCFLLSTAHGNEFDCLSGNCVDGYGTCIYEDGAKYVGEFSDNKENGSGTLTFASGTKYVGEFKDGLFSGQGTKYIKDGRKYIGEFKNDKYHGVGSYFWTGNSHKKNTLENLKMEV
jgi:hypothetical protein